MVTSSSVRSEGAPVKSLPHSFRDADGVFTSTYVSPQLPSALAAKFSHMNARRTWSPSSGVMVHEHAVSAG